MTDLTDVYGALQNADAAGDSASAKQLADYIRSQSPDVQAPASTPTALTYKDFLSALPETAAHLATGAVAAPVSGLVGLGTMAGNVLGMTSAQPADVVHSVQNAMTYSPRTTGGKSLSGAVGYLPSKYGQFADWAGQGVSDLSGSPLAGTIVNTAIQGLPMLIGSKYLGSEAAEASQIAPEVSEATEAGLKLTPEQAQSGLMGRMIQSLSGSAKLERTLSRENAPTVTGMAAEEIGLSGVTRFTPALIKQAKLAPNAVYDAAKGAGTVQLDPSAFDAVQASGTLRNSAVDDLREHYSNMDSIDANDLVTDVRQLRADSGKNIRAPYAPSQNSLGYAQRQTADALEGQLDAHLQSLPNPPVTLSDLQNARTQLAKIHNVEDSLKGGNVSAKSLSGSPYLTGNLRTIANAYSNFPRSFQDVSSIRDSGPFGVLDLGFGAAAAFTHPAAGAAVLARPLARAALASNLYQRTGIGGEALMAPTSSAFKGAMNTLPVVSEQQQYGLPSPDYLLR